MFARDEVRVKSWEGGTKELSTEIKVKKEDFEDYDVFNGRVDLTLPMREFRVCLSAIISSILTADRQATLALADQLSIKLVVAFSEAGQPLTLTSDPNDADQDETPDIFCAIATTTCDQFLTVRTQSDQPQSNGRTTSGSTTSTSFLNRNNSRQREFSLGADGSNGNGGDERNVRPRLSSEQPSRRGKLSLSTQPSRVPNSLPTTTTRTSGGSSTSQHQHRHNDDDDPLFIPTDTQYQNDHDDDHPAPRMSQAEVEAIAGLGDMDDILDGMDDLQHEEEVEEMRASQQAASQALTPPPPPSERQPLAERRLDDVDLLGVNTTLAEAASQALQPPRHPSKRQSLAERQLDDVDLLGVNTTLAEAAKQMEDADTTGGIEGEHEGDVTRQADFEVHFDYAAHVPENMDVPEDEPGVDTAVLGDITAGDKGGVDTTGPVDELEEEDEMLPPTQQPGDADSRVSVSSGIGVIADK